MQSLSAPKSDLQFFPYPFHLKFDHYTERLSDNVILRREPKNLERVSNLSDKILRFAQNDGRRHSVSCRTVFPVYFREQEMQNQRHEVCLNYIIKDRSDGVMEYCGIKIEREGSP